MGIKIKEPHFKILSLIVWITRSQELCHHHRSVEVKITMYQQPELHNQVRVGEETDKVSKGESVSNLVPEWKGRAWIYGWLSDEVWRIAVMIWFNWISYTVSMYSLNA